MPTYTLKNPKELGENDPKYGQTYWSYTHDSGTPVMFNLMDGQVGDGSVINAETVELKQSAKGTEYHRLKKVRVSGQQAITATKATDSELMLKKLDEILELLKHAPEGEPASLAQRWYKTTAKPEVEEDVVITDIGDEPINLDDIPF